MFRPRAAGVQTSVFRTLAPGVQTSTSGRLVFRPPPRDGWRPRSPTTSPCSSSARPRQGGSGSCETEAAGPIVWSEKTPSTAANDMFPHPLIRLSPHPPTAGAWGAYFPIYLHILVTVYTVHLSSSSRDKVTNTIRR